MKIRNGFVSNSSTSSFIVAYKGEKPTNEQVMESFGIAKDSPAAKLFGGIFKKLLAAESISKADIEDMRKYYSDSEALKLIDAGWTVLQGGASDMDGYPDEIFLCLSDIDISTDTLRIIKSAGY